MKVWTATELRTFLEHVEDDRLRGLYVVAAMTGMRRGELLALRWADVDLSGAQVAVRRSAVAVRYDVIEGEPKSGRARTIAIDPSTVAALKVHRKSQLVERARSRQRVDHARPLHARCARVAGAGRGHDRGSCVWRRDQSVTRGRKRERRPEVLVL